MANFIAGIFLLAIAATGNAGTLVQFGVDNFKSALKWILSLYILYLLSYKTPKDDQEFFKTLSVAILIGVILVRWTEIKASISSFYAYLSSATSGTVNSLTGNASLSQSSTSSSSTSSSSSSSTLTASQKSFLNSVLPYAQKAATTLGVPTTAVLAQVALETGYGTSSAYKSKNNVAGINLPGSQTGTNYQSYSSPSSSFGALTSLVQNRYPGAMNQNSVSGYASALQAGGYATDPAYASKISSVASTLSANGY